MNATPSSPKPAVHRDDLTLKPYQGQDLSDFPFGEIESAADFHRAHKPEYGPWYFASWPPSDGGDGGRFDLPAGAKLGTCYMANDELTALRERFGPEMLNMPILPFAAFRDSAVSGMVLARGYKVASLVSGSEVAYGIKASEMSSSAKYEITRSWATAWHSHAFEGVLYRPGWDPRGHAVSLALFGSAGPADGVYDGPVSGVDFIDRYQKEFATKVSDPEYDADVVDEVS